MSATFAVTRNVPGRFRGFFASCMLEVGPGIYVAPDMNRSVRERIVETLNDWRQFLPEDGGILFLWKDSSEPSGLKIHTFGWVRKNLEEHQGLWLISRELNESDDQSELEQLQTPEREHSTSESDPFPETKHLFDAFSPKGIESNEE